MVIFIYSRNEKKCAVGAGQIEKLKKRGGIHVRVTTESGAVNPWAVR